MSAEPIVIVGAGPAGLAVAGALRRRGRTATILEQSDRVGQAWHTHYDRLHLHTHRDHSGLPGHPMPRTLPLYPSRRDVVDYLDAYAATFEIAPEFGQTATTVRRQNGAWQVDRADAPPLQAQHVILATGLANRPFVPDLPGREAFQGEILHSKDYRRPDPFLGQRALVIGFGNSGGEIALDLAETGVAVEMSVRGPVNIVSRDILGQPAQVWSILLMRLPVGVADAITGPLRRLKMGDLTKYGLPKSPKGPMRQVVEDGRIPLLDIGTIGAIKRGAIVVRPGIDTLTPNGARFVDGRLADFDAVIAATGYRTDLGQLLPDHADRLDDHGRPNGLVGEPGLHFCGYRPVSTGQLRQIGLEAEAIAKSLTG
ncbi:MAG: NAD(P)/FAD-dependent oxidoreductase [Pseudomonadota bacterium]